MSRGQWYYPGIERKIEHPCRQCRAANMRRGLKRCHFRALRWGVCDRCGLPIFKDECRQDDGTVKCHVRCARTAQPRPAYMDRLDCLEVAA